MPQAPRVVPIGIPVDALARAAYMSYAVTKLKNEEGLDPEKRPEDQVTPFVDLPETEQGGWLAAAQGVLTNGGMTFVLKRPEELAIALGMIVAEEILATYPIRQAEDGNIRFPAEPDAGTWQMFGRIVARLLGKAKLVVPAAVAKGELRRLIGPAGGDGQSALLEPVAAIQIPHECYSALLDSGFKDGEIVQVGILDPMSGQQPPDAMLEPTEGEAH